jgi:hypothetical protein
VDKYKTGEDVLMTAVHFASMGSFNMTASSSHRAFSGTHLAVSARSRHSGDYQGTFTREELLDYNFALQFDGGQLHFSTEMRRGQVINVILETVARLGTPLPALESLWYLPDHGYIQSKGICERNEGTDCFVY